MCDVLLYVLGGLPMAVIVQVPDMWAFLKSSWNMRRPQRPDETYVISRESFFIFYDVVCKYERQERLEGKQIRAFDMIKTMRDKIDLSSQLITAIYGIDPKKMRERKSDPD